MIKSDWESYEKKNSLNELKPRDIAVDRRLMLLLRFEVAAAAGTQRTFTLLQLSLDRQLSLFYSAVFMRFLSFQMLITAAFAATKLGFFSLIRPWSATNL